MSATDTIPAQEMTPPLIDRLVSLTRDLVSIQSTERLPVERARCFSMFRNRLESVPGLMVREYESNGFVSMTAMPVGTEKPEVLMIGHLDVIEHNDPALYASTVSEGRIYGPGAGDMKGQLAIMLMLICNLQRQYPGISAGIAITSDEERGGEDGVGYLFDHVGLRCGLAIVPDGGSINDITVEEKGILQVRLTATGRECHAARPWLAPNALARITRAIVEITDHFDTLSQSHTDPADHWYPTCSPTICHTANESINCIPAEAHAYLDIRFPPPHTVAEMLNRVRDLAGPEVDVQPVTTASPTRLSPDASYLSITERLTGQPARLVRASGGSDARFISAHGIPVILSRPQVGNLHSTDEWIDIESMDLYYRICSEFILTRCQQAPFEGQ